MARNTPSPESIGSINIDRADRAEKPPVSIDFGTILGTIYGPDTDEAAWARRAVLRHSHSPTEAADWLAMLQLTEAP